MLHISSACKFHNLNKDIVQEPCLVMSTLICAYLSKVRKCSFADALKFCLILWTFQNTKVCKYS